MITELNSKTEAKAKPDPLLVENPYASLFWDMIRHAQEMKSSDVHIQPEPTGVEIRFRIHGELIRWKSIDQIHQSAFLQEAKRLCQCSLAISGIPQDSRISLPEQMLDIRTNLVPTLQGEKLVLRLLCQSRAFGLQSTGVLGSAICDIKRICQSEHGVALFTGPTGSGKTTLLYSALSELDRHGLNIVTLEDPVEYTFSGITQIPITSRLSFADGLRAILRQDPDVILVGEIRDPETAKLCFQAAATGHFVLSTLHANSASEVRGRLQGLGVARDSIQSCLKFAASQRLIPALCPQCALPMDEKDLKSGPGIFRPREQLRKRNRSGCERCFQGVTGRIPILEYIEWRANSTAEFRDRSEISEPLSICTPSLLDSAVELAKQGRVDIYDALHVE